MKKCYEKNKRKINFILWGLFIVWFWFFICKGIDVTDQGFYLTRYKYYFATEVNVKSFGTFFTDLLGAIIYSIFPSHQVFLLSVFSWLLYLCSGIVIYHTWNKYVSQKLLILSILIGSFFSMTFTHIMNYNATSMFIQVMALCCLFKGLEDEKKGRIAISGLLIGINTFFRLPNILEACFGLAVFWYYIPGKKKIKEGFQACCAFLGGVFGGWSIGGITAIAILGKESVLSYLLRTTNTLQGNETSHGAGNILSKLYMGGIEGIKDWIRYGYILIPLLILWFIYESKRDESKIQEKRRVYLGVNCIIVGYAIYVGMKVEVLRFLQMFGIFMIILLMFGIVYFYKKKVVLSSLCMAALLAECVLPIGTDNGWMYFLLFMMFPFSCCFIIAGNIETKKLKKVVCILVAGIAGLTICQGIQYGTTYVYRDSENKFLTQKVQAREYGFIHTSKERAQYIDELERELDSLDNKYLLALGDFNIGCVISDMKPYLDKVWVDLESYPEEQFNIDLKKSLKEKGEPVILLADIDKNGVYRSQEKYDKIIELIEQRNYKLHYDNGWYRIFVPD